MFLMAEYFFAENNENTYEQKFRNQKHDVTDRICTLSKLSKLILLLFPLFSEFWNESSNYEYPFINNFSGTFYTIFGSCLLE